MYQQCTDIAQPCRSLLLQAGRVQGAMLTRPQAEGDDLQGVRRRIDGDGWPGNSGQERLLRVPSEVHHQGITGRGRRCVFFEFSTMWRQLQHMHRVLVHTKSTHYVIPMLF